MPLSNKERAKLYRIRHPDRVKIQQKTYNATERGRERSRKGAWRREGFL